MSHEEIVKIVLWTMKYYGSDVGEKMEPGSKLKAQANHIADIITEWESLNANWTSHNFRPVLIGHDLK